ncbi:hypothetical protein [Streptococcus parauberis]|uniref:V-type sodium ATP synthase, subunit E family protein n=1 Tax=Streptococcus parauberis NCFD 2020 TaxID=873447 RepID=F1YY25_9STRE|nr:hypothetical protein [Streptococcus parauberis]EGE54783.1 V-type sodium ATP synthase, subunit E family protein [Streptococcus parauberis NCFD 2020]
MTAIENLKASVLEKAYQEGQAQLDKDLLAIDQQFDLEKEKVIVEKKESKLIQLKELDRGYQVQMQQLRNQERQSSLAIKQEVLKSLFNGALSKMENWEKGEELSFMDQILTKYQTESCQVTFGQITAQKFNQDDFRKFEETYPNCQFSKDFIDGEAGFVISMDKVDYTYLYSLLVNSLFKSECAEISNQLFSDR